MTEHEHNLTLTDDEEITYCEVHPDRETGLRCNKCGRLMCVECSVQTPVGYRCRDCVRQHEDKFFQGTNNDYVIVALTAIVLGAISGAIMSAIGFFFLALLIGLPVGGLIGEMGLRFTERRRGRYTGNVMTIAAVGGIFIGAAGRALVRYDQLYGELISAYERQGIRIPPEIIPSMSDFVVDNTFSLSVLLFTGMVAFAIYSRYRM